MITAEKTTAGPSLIQELRPAFLFMRLDVFLKTSRLIPRRSLAQKFCTSGLIMVDGIPAKASKEVKSGDEIEIVRGTKLAKYKVLNLPTRKQVSKSEAAEMTELVSETETPEFPN